MANQPYGMKQVKLKTSWLRIFHIGMKTPKIKARKQLDTYKENIYSNLSERIYSTRNSIVHSKQGDKPKFIPFKDKIDLFKEIPLIRFIAEEIVFATSKSIL